MMFSSRKSAIVAALLSAALVAGACDTVPLLAPSESTITVTAPTRVLAVGGSTEVQAFVLESSGTPVQNGTAVQFSTTLGTLSPTSAQTRNGVATTTFSSNASGTAEIRASSGAATGGDGATATNVVTIQVGSAAVATGGVTVRATPSSVPPNGGTVEVIATVVAEGGRLLSNVPVSFSATRGILAPGQAVTDTNGEARATLTTAEQSEVTARAGTVTSAAFTVTVRTGPSVTLTCTGPATGSTCANLSVGQLATFTAQRGMTTSAISSARLEFGDGDSVNLGNLSGPVTVTHAYTSSGTYTARLVATDVSGEQTVATQVVQVRSAAGVALQLEKNNLRVTATASVSGASQNDVAQYVFGFEGGSPASVTTTSNSAEVTYTTPGLKTVTVTVTFRDGRTATNSAQITVP